MEFVDVKSKDFIELAGVPQHRQGYVVAEHRVKWRLREILENRGVTHRYDQIFYSATADGVVIFSKSLVEILTEAVVNSERHAIQLGNGGAFYSVQHVMPEERRLNIGVDLANEVMAIVYDHIKETEAKG